MKTIGARSCSVPFVIAIVLLLQVSPALAGGQDGAPPLTTQRPVEVTFTKWITAYPLMGGVTGGDVPGEFVGEVLARQVSQLPADHCYAPPSCGRVIRLEAVYEVRAGDRSFAALIRGGTSGDTGDALLDGVILSGWRTGAQVRVAFQTVSSCTGPDGIVHSPCFDGTIRVERAPHK